MKRRGRRRMPPLTTGAPDDPHTPARLHRCQADIECDLVDLGIRGVSEDRPQRVFATPLLRPGAWHAESQGASPPTYRMRGVLPLSPAPGAAAAETARANLDLMMATRLPLTYLDRVVTPGTGPNPTPTTTDTTIARVLVRRWQLEDEDLINGRPYASRRWVLALQIVS